MPQLLISLLFFAPVVALADHPLCDDLARFACAPGSYNDGTGVVKSEAEVQKLLASHADKARKFLSDRFEKAVSDPQNAYFRDVAIAGLGLKNSPDCTSSDSAAIATCRANLVEGLTTLAYKQTTRELMPFGVPERAGNLEEMEFITSHKVYSGIVAAKNEESRRELGAQTSAKKIENKIFPKVKSLIIERLRDLPIEEDEKQKMITKVGAITFEGTACGELNNDGAGKGLASFLVPNAFYDPGQNTFKMCSGYLLQSDSEFHMAAVIGHELSHAIDPCALSLGPADHAFKYSDNSNLDTLQSEYPIPYVLECLRDERSVEATNLTVDPPESSDAMFGMGQGGGKTPPLSPRAMKQVKKTLAKIPLFCQKDQITESFADWMSAEVLPKYIESNHKLTPEQYRLGYANVRRVSCSTGALSNGVHPAPDVRINRILLANPKIRTQMGCSPTRPNLLYCDPNSRASADGPPPGVPPMSIPFPAGGTQ